jgi:Carboxypeptidase regulatory-like domain
VLRLLKGSRVVCAAAASVLACVSLACLAQDTTQTYPVHGVVLNSVTHQPIARVLVDGHQDAALTDNDGRFELNLPAGTIQMTVRRPGYSEGAQHRSGMVNVGANMADLTLYLTPQAIISGHITLSTGDEADGIRITAYRKRIVNGRERWMMQTMAVTNSEGAFRLPNLDAPASYLLYSMPAHDRIGAIAPGTTSFGYPSVFYPGVTDFSAAGVLTVSPGQQAQADFTLTRQPFYPVTISVAGHEGGRGTGVQIHDSSGQLVEFSTRWNPMQHTAQVNLPNGRYYAEAHSGGEFQAYGRVDFTVAGGSVSGLSLPMLPLHPIPVEVHKDFTASNSNGQQVAYGGLQAEFNAGLNLTLAAADAFEQQGGGGLRHPEGSSDSSIFQIDNVVPGRYWVETTPFEGYVSSITSGGVNLASEPLVIGPGNSTAPIEITLRNDGGEIQGQIQGQNQTGGETSQPAVAPGLGAVATTYVYAIPLFATTSRVPQGFTQGSGPFTISNLAPGSYHVIALDEPTEIDASDPQQLAKYTGKGQTVTVEANSTASVQLEVTPSTEVSPAP